LYGIFSFHGLDKIFGKGNSASLSCKVIQVLAKISAPSLRAVFFPKTLQDRDTELMSAKNLIKSVKDIILIIKKKMK
jgi:hypothetical protein